jgi:phosphoenolpyruvate synthase/pyruvate phosphate dikinase
MSKWVLDWEQAAKAGAAVAGGKGWNLGRLHRYGFRMPAGGVLVAEAYRQFMAQPGLRALWEPLAAVSAQDASTPETEAKLAAVRGAIRQAAMPAEIDRAIRTYLVDHGLAGRAVAVRSSATAEDSQAFSFAGIHESFLGLTGPDAVVRAVQDCYASLWTSRALAYRRRFGLPDGDVACAVVICAMVTAPGRPESVAAGVAFSCDPATGRRDVVVINAAPGLGDAVVSGSVNPEQITRPG